MAIVDGPQYDYMRDNPVNDKDRRIIKAFGSQAYRSSMRDVQPGALWSRRRIKAGQPMMTDGRFPLYSVTGLTDPFTNMSRANVLNAPEALAISKHVVSFPRSCSQDDVSRYIDTTVYEYQYMNKIMLRRPLSLMDFQETDPVAPVWTCQYCSAVFTNQSACPGCGSRQFSLTSHLPGGGYGGRALYVDITGHEQVIENQGMFMVYLFNYEHMPVRCDFEVHTSLIGLHARAVA